MNTSKKPSGKTNEVTTATIMVSASQGYRRRKYKLAQGAQRLIFLGIVIRVMQ